MTDAINFKGASDEDVENWLLANLEKDPPAIDDIISLLTVRHGGGDKRKCNDWADLVQDTLAEKSLGLELVKLLSLRSKWQSGGPEVKEAYRSLLTRTVKDRLLLAWIEGAFEGNHTARESFKRLDTLTQLQEGAYCCDGTWGFGIVKRLDDFYKKITIDFRKKPNHQMTFAYAGDTLEAIRKDHLLARRQDDLAEMERITREEPHTLVHLTLKSYGDLTVTQLQEILTEEGFVDDSKWKSFWDAARHGLKGDNHVEVPTKRSEPLRLLDEAKSYDSRWFATFAEERDAKTIYERIEELDREGVMKSLDKASREITGKRLAFAVLGAEDADPSLCVKIVLQADRFGFTGADAESYVHPHTVATHLAKNDRFIPACAGLAARDLQLFFKLLAQFEFLELADLLLGHIGDMPVQMLDESMAYLIGAGQEDQARIAIRGFFAKMIVQPQVLYWLAMNLAYYRKWEIGQITDLYLQAITCFETPATHFRLRAQKLLKGLFEDRDWLSGALELIDAKSRAHLIVRVRGARGWEEASRRSVMAKMIKLYPELEEMASEKRATKSDTPKGRFTSWRTYRERQNSLKELVEVSIPENSKEIAHARSYGDLRENFEYQAAKDAQGLLMRRKAEMERDLAEVRGTDFAEASEDAVSRGTVVDMVKPNGSTLTVTILGEWDRDEARGVISSESDLAKRLMNKRVGDEVEISFDEQELRCCVGAIRLLSPEIREWARGG